MPNLVDLSVTLQENIASDPPGPTPAIDYFTHLETAKELVSRAVAILDEASDEREQA